VIFCTTKGAQELASTPLLHASQYLGAPEKWALAGNFLCLEKM
jgi:hypothetical protein